MELVTEEQVTAAQQAVEQTGMWLATVKRSEPPMDGDRGQWGAALADARRRAGQAQAARDRLVQQAEAEAARAAAEAVAGPTLTETTAVLAQSRDRATAAMEAAREALTAMLQAVAEHDGVVKSSAETLGAAGLFARDLAGDHESGAVDGGGLVVRGQWWWPADGSAALAEVVYGIAVAALGRHHPLAARLQFGLGREALARPGGLLEGAPGDI